MRSKGFTLVEVLVAGVLTTFIILSVGWVYMGSTRAIHQGYMHMDAYELIRGADSVIRRDLDSVYTSRDHGDLHQFFGAPYGMSFIASRASSQSAGNKGSGELCRVTYVVRQISDNPDFPDKLDVVQSSQSTEPCFVLIRFVENGVDSLYSYPFGWNEDWWNTNTPSDAPVLSQQVQNLLRESQDMEARCAKLNLTAEATAEAVSAKRHELWLRMLRGNGPVRTPLGGWRTLNLNSEQLPDYFALIGKDPRDYVVATNISFSQTDAQSAFDLEQNIDVFPDPSLPSGLLCFGMVAFDYGVTMSASVKDANSPNSNPIVKRLTINPQNSRRFGAFQVSYNPFWGCSPQSLQAINAPIDDSASAGNVLYPSPYGGEGSPLLSRLPEVIHVRLPLKLAPPDVASGNIIKILDQTYTIPTAYTPPAISISLN